jgi:preprotein translocase subunit YajC
VNNSSGGSLSGLIVPLVLVGLLVLLFVNQRRRSRATQDVQRQLRPGMNVMTTAGLFAEVQAVDDDQVHLEIAPGIVCRFSRASVARVLDPPDDAPMGLHEDVSDPGLQSPHDEDSQDGRDGPPPAAPAT